MPTVSLSLRRKRSSAAGVPGTGPRLLLKSQEFFDCTSQRLTTAAQPSWQYWGLCSCITFLTQHLRPYQKCCNVTRSWLIIKDSCTAAKGRERGFEEWHLQWQPYSMELIISVDVIVVLVRGERLAVLQLLVLWGNNEECLSMQHVRKRFNVFAECCFEFQIYASNELLIQKKKCHQHLFCICLDEGELHWRNPDCSLWC